jgi:acetyl esterase/lipase
VVNFLVTSLVHLLPRLNAGWPLARIVAVAFLRSVTWVPFDQARSITLPTGEKLKAFCIKTGLTCVSVDISSSTEEVPPATLHFIRVAARPKARILLYFHGGAYVSPIDIKGQVPFALECASTANASDLVFLEYTLAPECRYPGQLIQAADALEYILRTHDPSQIVLGGDSAGGHLVLSLLAHIKRPNPLARDLTMLVGIRRCLRGAYVISPWVKMRYDSDSFRVNAGRDYIQAEGMNRYTAMWEPIHDEVWAEPLAGGPKFWEDIPVSNLLVTAGSWECFLDDILEMAAQLDAKAFGDGATVELSVGDREVHVQCALDKAVGVPHGHGALDILRWLRTGTHIDETQ